MMYQTIGNRPTIYKLYADKLIKEGTVTEEQTKQLRVVASLHKHCTVLYCTCNVAALFLALQNR